MLALERNSSYIRATVRREVARKLPRYVENIDTAKFEEIRNVFAGEKSSTCFDEVIELYI